MALPLLPLLVASFSGLPGIFVPLLHGVAIIPYKNICLENGERILSIEADNRKTNQNKMYILLYIYNKAMRMQMISFTHLQFSCKC